MGGRAVGGSWVATLRGDDGLEREVEYGWGIFVGGGLVERMGAGAWICMEMAKVGAPGAGTRARLMKEAGGGRRDGVELCRGRT